MKRTVFIVLIAAALAAIYYSGQAQVPWTMLISEETHATTFVILFMILPLVGFPISIFLILLGIRFDPAPALLIMFAAMAVHQAITFPAANLLLRPLIEKILVRRHLMLPQFTAHGYIWPCILFMAIPGLSYSMKNYFLSLSGIPFHAFFFISWLVQAVMGIPLVLAGKAIGERHFRLMLIVFALMATLYILRIWIVKRRRNKRKPL